MQQVLPKIDLCRKAAQEKLLIFILNKFFSKKDNLNQILNF